ncbi:MAG: GIY-YIG nuclease family protein [candidate division WOR-3 bacterium]|nr:MAG: GIY-YIG nuclease family protein [candidate division WOR-3 bacterium]
MKPSAYLLLLWNRTTRARQVGRLGRLCFEPGFYLYVGSGGPNVLKRILRHMRSRKPARWHIDHLTAGPGRMRFVDAWLLPAMPECGAADSLAKRLSGVVGFGTSDCRCPSHLFRARDISELDRALRSALPTNSSQRYRVFTSFAE